jgi:LPS-assembly lipoprotein
VARALRFAATVWVGVSLAACGFQLRGSAPGQQWPSALSTLHLDLEGVDGSAFERTLRNELTDHYRVVIAESGAPTLSVYDVSKSMKVLSLSSTGKASEYLLNYRVNFRVQDLAGKELLASQHISVRRDLSVGSENILAKEAERQRIFDEMEEAAAIRLLRRVASGLRGNAG